MTFHIVFTTLCFFTLFILVALALFAVLGAGRDINEILTEKENDDDTND